MAKFSVSIPDPLKESLDGYAKAHNIGISQVVQQALIQLLTGPEHPPPPTHQDNLAEKVEVMEKCLGAFAQHHELIRAAVAKLARNTSTEVYVPPPFPDIPW